MKTDAELERWQSLWQTDAQIPQDLRERAMRQVRRMRMMLAGDIAVTVLAGGGATIWGLNADWPSVKLLVIWIWITIFTAWIFRYFNNRGNWTGVAPSTDTFFELWVRRCRENLRNLQFGIGLGVVQLIVSCGWVYRELHRANAITFREFLKLGPTDLALLCAAGLFAWAVQLTRKARAELTYVRRLKQDWQDGEVATVHSPEAPTLQPKTRWLDSIVMFPSLVDSLDWQLRRRRRKRHGLPPI